MVVFDCLRVLKRTGCSPSSMSLYSNKFLLRSFCTYQVLAIRFEQLIRDGHVNDYSELAILGLRLIICFQFAPPDAVDRIRP